MSHILDASCLINLCHGAVLDIVLRTPKISGCVGPLVVGECASIKTSIDDAISAGLIVLLSDEEVDSEDFFRLLEAYNLGPGETECILFAKIGSDHVCMDDRKARQVAGKEIGKERVTGSLGLLRMAVNENQINNDEAYEAYSKMLTGGAFLPHFSKEGFRSHVLTK